MNRYKSIEDRQQLSLMPMCLDDRVAPDNVVRAIDAIVDNMDILSMGFAYSETKETGRKPYSPVDMLNCIHTAILMEYARQGR